MRAHRHALKWFVVFDSALLACSWLLYRRGTDIQAASLFAATIGFILWQIALAFRDSRQGASFEFQKYVQRSHWVQAFTQGSVYVYWAIYWDEVRSYALFIVAQILFAYVLETMLAWSRHKNGRLGFGPFPIVLSINLFFWFKPEYAYLQLLLVSGAYLAKEFVVWNRDGKRTHIFNPSAITLAVAGILLMLTNGIGLAYGVDLITALYLPPNFYEVLFLLGLIPQFLFATTLITGGAALALSIMFFSLKAAGFAPQSPFDVSVFIGLNLLVTDPATSPRTRPGKLLFGMTYGFGIVAAYIILRYTHQASFFDKIMPVLLVNLLVRQFDTAGIWLFDRVTSIVKPAKAFSSNYLHLALYGALFVFILPHLKVRDPEAVDTLPPQSLVASPEIQELLAKAMAVDSRYNVRQPWGFKQEFLHFADNQELDRDTADANLRRAKALLLLGQNELAQKRLQRSVEKDPSYIDQVAAVVAPTARFIPR
jgi:hypothetical protein